VTITDPQDDIAAALRGELHARAARVGQPSAPTLRLEAAVRRDRIRRRGLAGGAAVALIAALATSFTAFDGIHLTTSTAAAAGQPGRSPLFAMSPRGNLVNDANFMADAAARLDAGMTILYANDDGDHVVVIGGAYLPAPSDSRSPRDADSFLVLVGPHKAGAAQLVKSATVGLGEAPTQVFTFVGTFTGDGKSQPYVVLGPLTMNQVDLASGIELSVEGGRVTAQHTGIRTVAATEGVAAGELPGPSTKAAAAHQDAYFSARARLASGTTVDADPAVREVPFGPAEYPLATAYDAVRAAVVDRGRSDGLTNLQLNGPGGDAVADNAVEVVYDVANIARVAPSKIEVNVEWVGQETTAWDSALLDINVPGFPHIQAFVRGLAPGQSDSASPGLARSYVRPAQPLTPSHLPETAQAFGGTPELTTLGGEVEATW
jgi:hypothetical protein